MIRVALEIKKIPKTCSECPFYRNEPYTCHNERGTEAHCLLGYMSHKDMRDVDFRGPCLKNERFSNCLIEANIIQDGN